MLPTITEMVIIYIQLPDNGLYRPVYEGMLGVESIRSARLSRELTFGLKPAFQLMARLCPASEKKFVGASPDFVLTRGHTKHNLAVQLASCHTGFTGRHSMNSRQVPGDVLPGVGRILERVYSRDVRPYGPLFEQS